MTDAETPESAEDEAPEPIEKAPGHCRFADCTTTATQVPDVALSDDHMEPVELCGPHAGMLRSGRLPPSLSGSAVAADGGIVVGLPPADAPQPAQEQVQVPVFFPMHPADGPTPKFVRAQQGPQGGVVTMESPLHPGELEVYTPAAMALLIRQCQTELRKASLMPVPVQPSQHPMAQGPIVAPSSG